MFVWTRHVTAVLLGLATNTKDSTVTIFTLVFLLIFLIELVLLTRVAYLTLRKDSRGKKTLAWVAGIALTYTVVLVGVGIGSRATQLPLGQQKCFDDWCFVVRGSQQTVTGIDIQGAAVNRGWRAQAPDSPQVFSIVDGKQVKLNAPLIRERVEGHAERQVTLHVDAPANSVVELLVTEGGGPSMLIIDDENSPFHAKSTWLVTPPANGREIKR